MKISLPPYDADRLCRAVLSGALALPPELDDHVRFGADTHVLLRHAAAEAYLRIPEALRRFLAARGVFFMLGSYYDAAVIHGAQETLSPGYKDNLRRHRNQSPGLYDKGSKTAYAFQYVLNPEAVPIIGQKPDPVTLAAGLWRMNTPQAVASIARHETWHAVDCNAGLPSRWRRFRQAYAADVVALGGGRVARAAGLGYFIQEAIPHRGASEVFAESGAALNGGGVRDGLILRKFPRCAEFVHDLQAAMIVAGQNGVESIMAWLAASGNNGGFSRRMTP